jgi:hypothetical protein
MYDSSSYKVPVSSKTPWINKLLTRLYSLKVILIGEIHGDAGGVDQDAFSGDGIDHLEAPINERYLEDNMVLVGDQTGAAGIGPKILDVELALERDVLVLLGERESGIDELVTPGLPSASSKELGEGSVLVGHLK